MNKNNLLEDIDLAALLCSRVCHDVISPVGAIANGLEILEEEDDPEMRKIASDLITQSAKSASAKLQFCRMAFGAAGSMGTLIDVGEAGDITKMFIGEEKISLVWNAPREQRPKSEVKLLLNMVLMGMSAIPRGGDVIVDASPDSLTVRAVGDRAKIPEKSLAVMNGDFEASELDARLVQVYYAMRLASEAKYQMSVGMAGDDVVFGAKAQTVAASAPMQDIA
ncbi:hypothetical protein MNBD_ALPHA08-913 [hydrothermal vent metagenome]|uniref:Histidine phosphotransferase ChpT C-terminal domain-containing protein n=1 Tax=hydrothermal vent metagenome TaxID=652676 RepID=A0A3B0RI37_9ZZZZ